MMKRREKKKTKIYAALLSCLIAASSLSVNAAGNMVHTARRASEKSSGIVSCGYYVEPCWRCRGGSLYRVEKGIARYRTDSEKSMDDSYLVQFAYVYTCNQCSFGWTETARRTEVDCHDCD